MTNRNNARTLATYATSRDIDALKRILDNAIRLYGNTITLYGPGNVVAVAARERLVEMPIAVITAEYHAMHRATIAMVTRAPRLNTLLTKRGTIGALIHLMQKSPSEAFGKLIAAGRKDETAEAIVVRHAAYFPATAVATARARLSEA